MAEFTITVEAEGNRFTLSPEQLERLSDEANALVVTGRPKPFHHVARGLRDHWIGCLWYMAESCAQVLDGSPLLSHVIPLSVAVCVPFVVYYGRHHVGRLMRPRALLARPQGLVAWHHLIPSPLLHHRSTRQRRSIRAS
jgi:hypothetical protein